MTKEILEQAVLDYISEKFRDKVVDKRVQTFFTYSELVDTVLSFAELLNKNIEELEQENRDLPAIAYQQGAEWWKEKSDKELKEAKEIIAEMLAYGIQKLEVTERAKKFLEEK